MHSLEGKYVVRAMLACLSLLMVTGCWSRVEINDRLYVSVLFIDAGEKEGQIKLTIGFPLPNRMTDIQKGSSEGGNPYGTITKTGSSIAIAYRKIQSDLSRKINWSHVRVIVVGDQMARNGLRPILEFATRQTAIQSKAYIFLAEGEAQDVASLTTILERFPSEVLREMAVQKNIVNTTLRDLVKGGPLLNDALIGRVNIEEKKLLSEKEKVGKQLINIGAGIIVNEHLTGYLTLSEQRGALWVQGMKENAMISIPSPVDGKEMDFLIHNPSTKITVHPAGRRVEFHIRIRAEVDVFSSASNIELQKPQEIARVEQALDEDIKQRIDEVLERSQQLSADMFQFGRYLEWYYPDLWNKLNPKWQQHYREDVDLVVDTKVKIDHLGGVSDSYWEATDKADNESGAKAR